MEQLKDLHILYNFHTLKFNSFSDFLSENLTKLQADNIIIILKKHDCCNNKSYNNKLYDLWYLIKYCIEKPINNCEYCYYYKQLVDGYSNMVDYKKN